MTIAEIAGMDGSKCILQLRGVRPFLSDKYDITKHKNYKYLSDFDDKNTFDIEAYISTRLNVKDTDEFTVFHYAVPEDEIPEEAYADFATQAPDTSESEMSGDTNEPEFEEDYEPL
jgi:type IV secretion system protein VirD4